MKFMIETDQVKADFKYSEISISPNEVSGYRPFELFVSSLAGCSGTLLRTILSKKRISYQKLEMEVDSVRNPDEANRIEKLSFLAHVETESPFTPEQAAKIAELVIKNCGMIQSVIETINIKFEIQASSIKGTL